MYLSREQARRIDRLARAAHAFHRHAHHPLCDEYRSEVVRLGRRTRLCLGCLLVVSGLTSGLVIGAATRWAPAVPVVAALVLVPLVLSRRRSKLLTRFAPAFLLGGAAGGAATLGIAPAVALATLVVVIVGSAATLYRRRGPNRTACARCPERSLPEPCRGLRPIVRRERAFQRLAQRIIQGQGMSTRLPHGAPGP